jgi:predicted RNase H-like nuclease (RuvC/YqgF family)
MKDIAASPRSVNRLIQQIKNLSKLIEDQEIILYQMESQIDRLRSPIKVNDNVVEDKLWDE